MTNEKTEVPAIYGALANVMKGLANIPKNGTMRFGSTSYEYLRADDVQERINPLLIENGIIVQSQYGTRDVEKGNRWFVYVDLRLNYISTKDGSSLASNATGESIAGDDKSVNKALTQAIKNCHRAMFQFTSGEVEPDDIVPGAEGSKSASSALDKARNNAEKSKPKPQPDKVNGDSVALITKEFIETKKRTREQVKALAADIKKDTKKDGEELYAHVLRVLRSEYGDSK